MQRQNPWKWRLIGMRTLALVALLAAPFTPGQACSCMEPGPPCQAAWAVTAVFTGIVIDIREPAPPAPPAPPAAQGQASARRMIGDPTLPWPKRVVRMRLGEVLTGVSPGQKEIEIVTGMGGGDCGYRFQFGVGYVVYAYKNSEGRLETGICSRTRALTEAAAD